MKYKLSYYIIITEPIDQEETKQILYATRTSTALVLHKDVIQLLLKSEFDGVSVSMLQELLACEAIVPEDENELEELAEKSKLLSSNLDSLQFTVQTTANCQLGCNYCGQQHVKQNMSDTLIDNVVKRFELILSNRKYKQVDVSWFGGEPLMSWSVMKKLSPKLKEIAKNVNCKYMSHLVSNGLSLKSEIYQELASEMDCTFIEITLDGTKEFHDQRRDTKLKESTFDIIFSNLLSIVNREDYPINNCYISVRCNVDDRNKDGVVPLIKLLSEHKLQDKIRFYTARVYSWGNEAHLLTANDSYSVDEIDWFIELYNAGFNFSILPRTNPVVCSAVTPDYELIDPWGKVYNCTETPLVPFYGSEYVIGNISKDITNVKPFEQRPYTDWYDRIQDKKNEIYCTTCKILPVCGGRCPKSWMDGIPPCPSMKFNMEDRLILSYIHSKTTIKELIEK